MPAFCRHDQANPTRHSGGLASPYIPSRLTQKPRPSSTADPIEVAQARRLGLVPPPRARSAQGPTAATMRRCSRWRRSHRGGPSGTGHGLDRLGPRQQPQGPRRRASRGRGLRIFPPAPSSCTLGDVAVDRLQADDPARPQPLGQLVDQAVELGGVGVGGEVGLGGGQGCRLQGLEQHELDTEADVDAVQLQGEEAEQVGRVADRPAGADDEARHLAVDPRGRGPSARRRAPSCDRSSPRHSEVSRREVAAAMSSLRPIGSGQPMRTEKAAGSRSPGRTPLRFGPGAGRAGSAGRGRSG